MIEQYSVIGRESLYLVREINELPERNPSIMKKKASVLSIFLIALGALEIISQGYDIIGGGAPLKTWVVLVFGLFLLVLGLIMVFGKGQPSSTTPQEDALVRIGVCIGWGACTLLSWIDQDCVFNHTTLVNIGALFIFFIWTILKKELSPEE